MRNDLIVGARFFGGRTQANQYVNVNGNKGAQTLDSTQTAFNYEAYVENRLFFVPTVALMTGVKVLHSVREYIDNGGLPRAPNYKSTNASYSGVNPKLGLLWQPDAHPGLRRHHAQPCPTSPTSRRPSRTRRASRRSPRSTRGRSSSARAARASA